MENYNYIENKINLFIKCWQNKDTTDLKEIIDNEAECYLSMEDAYNDGSRHALTGVSSFFEALPDCSHSHINLYNLVIHINTNKAKSSAVVVGTVMNEANQVCEFSGLIACNWIKKEDWLIHSLRFELTELRGDFEDYFINWHTEDKKAKWYQGVHLPVISGELDSPFEIENEDKLPEEKLIMEAFYEYGFGIDTLSFHHLNEAISDDCFVNMPPFGIMDKRMFMQTLKLHRQPDLHWIHPAKVKSIQINGNEANLQLYRMAGHRQRHNPYIITKDNIDIECACARYEIKMKKNNGKWQINKLDYFLGTIPIGKY